MIALRTVITFYERKKTEDQSTVKEPKALFLMIKFKSEMTEGIQGAGPQSAFGGLPPQNPYLGANPPPVLPSTLPLLPPSLNALED